MMKKIVIHDFAGLGFVFDLPKELSKNPNFKVYYLFFDSKVGPKGDFSNYDSQIKIIGIKLPIKYSKNSMINRLLCELIYGAFLLVNLIKIKPNIVLSGNSPIDIYWGIFVAKKILKFKLIYWSQDIYGIAIKNIFEKKIGLVGSLIGKIYEHREKQQFLRSDALVTISDIMHKYILSVVKDNKINVSLISNWGNLSEISYKAPVKSREIPTLVYTGTLGFKHDPDVLIQLSNYLKGIAIVEIYTHGAAVDYLKNKNNSSNLKIFDLLPHGEFIKKLESASAFICLIEEDASKYCVPSKVQNYLCAGRPIFIIGDFKNAASQIIKTQNCGYVVSKEKIEVLSQKINFCFQHNTEYLRLCKNARLYAEHNFKIYDICKKFEQLF
ncbi:hypothetical protein N9X12_01110 [Alphaproteobacteria bacterium]|nr:hypothetical protein [Alphaproteobacteria bacterium]